MSFCVNRLPKLAITNGKIGSAAQKIVSPRLRTSTKQLSMTCAMSKIRLAKDPLIEVSESSIRRQSAKLIGMHMMVIHKRILEWQAAHPIITWAFWGIVWAIVLVVLLRPQALE
jgi:hypothetical protein